MDVDWAFREKAWRQSQKNATSCIKKSWKQHPTKQQLYGYRPPISKTIQVRRICWTLLQKSGRTHKWRSPWTSSHGLASVGWPARTYLHQLCADTGCSLEDRLGVMDDRDEWRERVREIRARGTRWWWWWWRFPYRPYVACSTSCRLRGHLFK